jgi:hypothetical protein
MTINIKNKLAGQSWKKYRQQKSWNCGPASNDNRNR